MKTNRWLRILLAIFILMGFTSVQAASTSLGAVQKWKVQVFKGAEANVLNLSTAFAGKSQIPILSYAISGSTNIRLAHAATAAVPGNCGPNNKWYCAQWHYGNLVPASLSPIAVEQRTDTHLIGWAFSTGSRVRGAMIELKDDMSYVSETQGDLIDLGQFGGTLVGAPSVRIVGGHYQVAVTVGDNSDLYGHKLVFMSYTIASNTSCGLAPANYYCVVVDTSNGSKSMGAPSLGVASGGIVGIAYYKAGATNGLMFAYPNLHLPTNYSNCGSSSWRCISIFPDTDTGAVGADVKLAAGHTPANLGIAYTYGNASFGKYLFRAGYVESGGNCGADLNASGDSVNKWQCNLLVFLGKFNRSYSISLDPLDYPVLAYEYASEDLAPVDLYITYPNARAGLPGTGWVEQKIDGAPTTTVTTGGLAALALSTNGLGFISYLQEAESETPDLKIAWQQFELSLPLVRR
jgi:hypothetical protein